MPEEKGHFFGDPEAQRDFYDRNPTFFAHFDYLNDLMSRTLVRVFTPNSQADKLVHLIGRLTVEDFMELFLLAANGYGFGALKLVRGQFERTVTAGYIAKYPEKAQRFLAFGDIQYRKIKNVLKDAVSPEDLLQFYGKDGLDEIERRYEAVKSDFEESLCKQCGTKRPSPFWDMDIPSMARRAGYGLDRIVLTAYAIPTQQAHSSVMSIVSRLGRHPDQVQFFDDSAQPGPADFALSQGHALMITMLRIQNEHFNMGADKDIEVTETHYNEIWRSRKPVQS